MGRAEETTTILLALWSNIVSWFVRTFAPSLLPSLLPPCSVEQATGTASDSQEVQTRCISIGRPGGMEQLRTIILKPGYVTCGYNVRQGSPFVQPSDASDRSSIIQQGGGGPLIVLKNLAFSVNYADCCIRWGLYESARQFVGYPIVPGFDVAGQVEKVISDSSSSTDCPFQVGDLVFGCSLFGAYSSRVLVPALQLRKIPKGMAMSQAASLPAVSLTALYALFLAGHYPAGCHKFNNKAILIHSAAGGVGGMLVQMSKILGLAPIVGVVGHCSKVQAAKNLGCHVVIDKSSHTKNDGTSLWQEIRQAAAEYDGCYGCIMDANGVSTLQDSYNHLAMTGRLVVYGFHSNLPLGRDMLSPMEWLRMAWRMSSMPKIDPMDMTANNKAVLAFNLSFFANERAVLMELFDQVLAWLENGQLKCPRVVAMEMKDIQQAHELIQSGKSIGKIVLTTGSA